MPPPVKLSRNITDFFRPFAQPRNPVNMQGGGQVSTDPKKDQREQTRSQSVETSLNHENSINYDVRGTEIQSDKANAVTLGQEPEDVAGTSQTSAALQLPRLAGADDTRDDGIRSSSLTPVDSESPSPMEDLEPTLMGRRSFRSVSSNIADRSRSFGEDSFVSGSQRVTRNGEVVIANSDEDTDSQDSFEDLDELLNLPKLVPEVSRSNPQPEGTRTPYTLRSKPTLTEKAKSSYSWRNGSVSVRKPDATTRTTTKAPKFSLQMLIAQSAADQAVEAAAQTAENSLKTMEDNEAVRGLRHGRILEEDAEALVRNVEVGNGDEDTADRLLRAVQRSQVLKREKSWSFFDLAGSDPGQSRMKFPNCSLQGKWATQMQVPSLRDQAFLSGFIGEVASKGRLPAETLYWMLDALCWESSQILRDAYCLTLMNAAEQTSALLSSKAINQLFRRIGASGDATDLNTRVRATVRPSSHGDSQPLPEWSKLVSVLELLAGIAKVMEEGARYQSLFLMCRLAFDGAAMRNGKVVLAFETAFTNLLDSISLSDFEQELRKLLATVSISVEDPQLQVLLLRSIPTSGARASIFRRRLALAWFFQDEFYLGSEPDRPSLIPLIRNRLGDSDLRIHPSTDFLHLGTTIVFLDVAIGDGSPPMISTAAKDAVKDFNKEVDKLATILKGMAADINDTGEANLTRAEAKDLLESFLSRLVYTIRTKAKPRKDIFDSSQHLSQNGPKRRAGQIDDFLVRRPKDLDLEETRNKGVPDDDSELLQYQWEQDLAKAF